MKLWRGLTRRIVLTSFVAGIIGFFASQIMIVHVIRKVSLERLEKFGEYVFERWERPLCESDPAKWSIILGDDTHVYAYDDATLRSHHPDAPPLDRKIYEDVVATGQSVVVVPLGPARGGLSMFRTPRRGPCSVIVAYWPTSGDTNQRVLVVPFSATMIVGWLAIGIAVLFVIRPLARRVQALRNAAEKVGNEEGYTPAEVDTSDDMISALAASLDRAHKRIRDDAERLRDRQLALERHLDDVAHDLRTPLASLQLALEQAADASTGESAVLLVGALRDIVYISGLTDDLRLATQLRGGWDPLARGDRTNLGETIERVASRSRSLARRRGIELEVAIPDEPVTVQCDAIAVEKAISNVVQNAIAYGEPGGHVALLLEHTAGRFAVRVIDDGPGVPPADLPRLGERTFRSDAARQRDPRGSGLGLAITSEICARCQWELRFAAEEPRGLRVEIEGASV